MRSKKEFFEVIDQHNGRHRFDFAKYRYEWRLKPGALDIEGNEFLDIYRADGFEVVIAFPNPARVGVVTEDTELNLPLRELQAGQCPLCGFIPKRTK